MKHALILHNPVSENSRDDELDVLNQAELIEDALIQLGYTSERMAFGLNYNKLGKLLKDKSISVVFNLVETIGNAGRLSFIAPAILELTGVPFSGSGAETIFITTDKVICKKILTFNAINTPDWTRKITEIKPEMIYIPKPISEDGSVGIDDILTIRGNEVKEIPQGYFLEEYIHGREFNISVIGGENRIQVLPPAEMCFEDNYFETKPHILGYKAKWDEASMEYKNTTRSFQFDNSDVSLIETLIKISVRCWEIFGLRGYARIDFRIGNDGIPWVIEINANPCIAPDSGFVAACHEAKMENVEIIKRIIEDAKQYSGRI